MNLRRLLFRSSGLALNALSVFAPGVAGRMAMRLFGRPYRRLYSEADRRLFAQARRSFRFQSGQHTLQAYCWAPEGASDEAPAALLLHGWESHSGRWGFLIPELIRAGFRVYAMDAPAHGLSDGRWVHILIYAEAVRALIRQEGPMRVIIGHSFGGAAAVAAFADLPPSEHPYKMAIMGAFDRTTRVVDDFGRNLKLRRRVIEGLYREIQQLTGHPASRFSIARMAGALHTQGLVIHDRGDAIVPFEEGQAIAEAMRQADFMPTEGFGHGLKNREIVRRIGDFVRE